MLPSSMSREQPSQTPWLGGCLAWPHSPVSWTSEEASSFAAGLLGKSEADVRAEAAQAGVDLRVIHLDRSEWHTDAFQRNGVTVRIDRGVAVSAQPG